MTRDESLIGARVINLNPEATAATNTTIFGTIYSNYSPANDAAESPLLALIAFTYVGKGN